jgi:hypothetical protein
MFALYIKMNIENIENHVPFREQIKKINNNKCVYGFTIASFLTSFSVFVYLLATPEKIVYNNVVAGNPSFRPTMMPTMEHPTGRPSASPTVEPTAELHNVILSPTYIPHTPSGFPTSTPSFFPSSNPAIDSFQ